METTIPYARNNSGLNAVATILSKLELRGSLSTPCDA